jgi:spore photoproduct lyase
MINALFSHIKIRAIFGFWGVNKRQEISRLAYEIAKREKLSVDSILISIRNKDFFHAKQYLLKRRYPFSSVFQKDFAVYLPKLEINPANECAI